MSGPNHFHEGEARKARYILRQMEALDVLLSTPGMAEAIRAYFAALSPEQRIFLAGVLAAREYAPQ